MPSLRTWSRGMLLALLVALVGLFSVTAQDAPTPTPAAFPLTVSEILPADGAEEVAADSLITVVFSRPVVPLGVDNAASLPNPLTLSPAAAGTGAWLNTFIYQFDPDPALAGGTRYTVTVNAGLTAVDGATLAESVTSTFSTISPEIVEFVPREGHEPALLDDSIQIRFNQPMDRASTEASFRMQGGDGGETVTGAFEWADDDQGFRFTPDAPLRIATRYQVQFSSINGLPMSASGSAELVGTTEFFVDTIPYPGIRSTYPGDGEQRAYPYGGFTLYFLSPMQIDTLRDRIVIDPAPVTDDYDTYYAEYDDSYSLSFPVEPSTTYTVTLLPGMMDIYGNTIDTTTTVTYTTDRYGAELTTETFGQVGFYNADNPETRVFIKHMNVSQVDLALYRVSSDSLLDYLTRGYSNETPSYFDLTPETEIKAWTIPSAAPLNNFRYEYLSLGTPANEVCSAAPGSRVQVGDLAVITTDDETLRVRSTPLDGSVLFEADDGYTAPIIGGPTCAGNFTWWQIQTDQGPGWVAEGDSIEYYIDVAARAVDLPIDVTDGAGNALPPGVYFLRITAPEIEYPRYHILVVGDSNIVLKNGIDSAVAWVTDVTTGQPIPNVPVEFFGPEGVAFGTATTDADGLARTAFDRQESAYNPVFARVDAPDAYGIAFNGWSSGIEGYNFDVATSYYPQQVAAYLYTDRPVYRPDQPVYFFGAIRLKDDVEYTAPDLTTLPARIFDPQGNIIWEGTVDVDAQTASFSAEYLIAPDAELGYYRFDVILPGEDRDDTWSQVGTIDFGVAEYRLPEFQVTVTPDAPEVSAGDTLRVLVDSRYYFGGAVSGATVTYQVSARTFFFDRYDGPGNYSFNYSNPDGGPDRGFGGGLVTSGELVADERGIAVIEFEADLRDGAGSQTFTIEATVSDESGQAVSGRAPVIVHASDVYVGVRAEQYVGQAGEANTFQVIAVDPDGAPIAGQSVDLAFVERRWFSTQEQDGSGRTTWNWEVEEIEVGTTTVTTDAEGRASAQFTPPNGGVFAIRAFTRDDAGRESRASATTWVSSRQYVAWRQQNSNRIDLIADKADYAIGETAEILIASPFQGATEALVTVERGDVLFTERITLESNSTVYRLPITEDYAPNIAVSVFIVKGVDETNPVAGFRMGLIGLNVDIERRVLDVSIAPDVETAGPGDTVTYTVTTADYAGNPVPSGVSVGLTDLAALSIADPNQVDPVTFFFSSQGLGVRTSSALTINVDQLTQTLLDTLKGGGGGFGEGGIFDIREDFVDTAYWNGALITGADGTATFSVTLPDNLTTWRLDARAFSLPSEGQMRVGRETHDLLSTKPVLIRPVTPRFFVQGDEVELAAIVNNNTQEDLTVEVALVVESGVTFLNGAPEQTVTIAAGTRQRVNFPVRIETGDETTGLDLIFTAVDSTGRYNDASRPPISQGAPIPVLRYEVPETVGTAGVIDAADTRVEGIVLPTAYPVQEGTVTVEIEPSLASSTLDALEVLRIFPHYCIEQTISRFLPNIMTLRALDAAGLEAEGMRASLDATIELALQKLYAEQKVGGGWGWYVTSDSDPLNTAYALIGLSEARASGYTVSASVIEGAQRYLNSTWFTLDLNRQRWELDRQAFVLYALARSGAPEPSRMSNLFEVRERLSLYARAFLALALAEVDADDPRAAVLLSDLLNAAQMSATGTHWTEEGRDYWNWNTNTRTTALALAAFVRLNPDSELIPGIVRYLVSQRRADAWETTQETAWSVMALTDYMLASDDLNPQYTFDAALNGESVVADSVTPDDAGSRYVEAIDVAELLTDGAVNELAVTRGEGTGNLYYRAFLEASLPVDQVQAVEDRGIIVQRRYELNGAAVTGAAVGDTVQVRLTIIAPGALHYVIITDPIPAGTDAVDPRLNTSQSIGIETGGERLTSDGDRYRYGWGWWYFDNVQFRDEQVEIAIDYLPAGTYEYVYNVRAGLAGTYQVIPPTAQEFYFPEVYGRGAGTTFTITSGS